MCFLTGRLQLKNYSIELENDVCFCGICFLSTLFAVRSSATFRVVDFWVLLVGLQSRTLGSIWDSLETFCSGMDVSKNRGYCTPQIIPF